MSGTKNLVEELKAIFKARGLTYAKIAQQVDLSEASVKRLMSSGQMTLTQLDAFCAAAGMTVMDVAAEAIASETRDQHYGSLTTEQETLLAADDKLFVFYYKFATDKNLKSAAKSAGYSETDLTRALVALDKFNFITLHAENRVTLKVPHFAQWLIDGPLAMKYGAKMREFFFDYRFDGSGEIMRFHPVLLTPETAKSFKQRVTQLAADIALAHKREARLPESRGVALLVGLRDWTNALRAITKK